MSVGTLAAGVAHEINNPLAIIKGMCFVINKRTKAEKIDERFMEKSLDTIVDNVSRISKILGFVEKLSVSDRSSQMQSTTAKNIIDAAVFLANDLIKSERIHLDIQMAKDIVISCRLSSIARALANLIINSFESLSRSEHAWVKVIVEEAFEHVKFTVIDSGHGIAEEHLPFITDPFYTTKDVGEGNGLGLAITKAILEDHDGSLRYDLLDGHTGFIMAFPTKSSNKALFI